jgi:hypothetical protein
MSPTGVVEFRHVGHAEIGCRRPYPGIAATRDNVGETAGILKNEDRVGGRRRGRGRPIDAGVVQFHIEIGDHRTAVAAHVGRRSNECFLHVMYLLDQCLLRCIQSMHLI